MNLRSSDRDAVSVPFSDDRGLRPRAQIGLLVVVQTLLLLGGTPQAARAQLGALEALGKRVQDLSFYGNLGGLLPSSDEVDADPFRLTQFGVELLFGISVVERTCARRVAGWCPSQPEAGPQASAVPLGADTLLNWVERQVVTRGAGTDTTDIYQVEVVQRRAPPMPVDTVWEFEMGFGYGQLLGFEEKEGGADLRGSVRELPAVSLYAVNYPSRAYLGLRSGFLKVHGLQAITEGPDGEDATVFKGTADSFLLGAAVGTWFDVSAVSLLLEASYAVRTFPSISWSGSSLPADLPRKLNLNSWMIGTGIQIPIGN